MSHFSGLKIDTRKQWWNILDGISNWNAYNKKRFPSRLSTGICFCQVWLYFVPVKYWPVNMKLFQFVGTLCDSRASSWWQEYGEQYETHVPHRFMSQLEGTPEKPTACSSAGTEWKYLMRTNHCDDTERFLFLSIRPSCCLIQSSHATPLACTLIFPKSRLQYYVCQIPLWIGMISSIMSCINGLQSLGKQHKGVFCQIHWDSSPSMLHVFLLLLLLSGKTSPQYVKSSK